MAFIEARVRAVEEGEAEREQTSARKRRRQEDEASVMKLDDAEE